MQNPNDFFETYPRAALQKDKELMIGLYSETVVIYDLWDEFSASGKQKLRAQVSRWFDSLKDETVHVEFSDIEIQQDGASSFAHASIRFKAISAQGIELRAMNNRISLGFFKTGGQWLVVHQ